MHKPLCLALLLAASAAHALAADDSTRNSGADSTQQAKPADSEEIQALAALADLQQRAAAGDADAQNNLGLLYKNGEGVAQN